MNCSKPSLAFLASSALILANLAIPDNLFAAFPN